MPRTTGTDRSYSCPVRKKQRPPATARDLAPLPRHRIWRRRVAGTLMVGAVYGPVVALPDNFYKLDWHWWGSFHIRYGDPLSLLPGVVLTALLAPRVACRRRDALTLLFPPRGIRVAWIIGTRLGQLPHRDWPARTDGIELQGRQAARIGAAVNYYRLWRQRRVGQATAALPPARPWHAHAVRDSEHRSIPVTGGPAPADSQD